MSCGVTSGSGLSEAMRETDLRPESLGRKILGFQVRGCIVKNGVAHDPCIQGRLPLFQPNAGLLLHVTIGVVIKGVQGIK